ncbi:MAG: T9SS type A sorting domain-containing protein [Cytophagales bacterium]|nr:T9SS type A sorting domain-containing protein [Cytophagales bacterium]
MPAKIDLYPNPAPDNQINIKFGGDLKGQKLSISVMDMFGRVLQERDYAPAGNQISMDLGAISKGN